jgi:hypothetical protein
LNQDESPAKKYRISMRRIIALIRCLSHRGSPRCPSGPLQMPYVVHRAKRILTGCAQMALLTAMADQDYRTAEVIVAALAKEHGARIASPG